MAYRYVRGRLFTADSDISKKSLVMYANRNSGPQLYTCLRMNNQ